MAINRFVIVGRVARELALRSTTSGMSVATYPVAINRVWYSAEGERREECDFIPATSYGAQVGRDLKHLAKGRRSASRARSAAGMTPRPSAAASSSKRTGCSTWAASPRPSRPNLSQVDWKGRGLRPRACLGLAF